MMAKTMPGVGGQGGSGGAGFVVNAVDFSSDYLTRGGLFTGAPTTNSKGIFSAWLRLDGSNNAAMRIMCDDAGGYFVVQRLGSNEFRITLNGTSLGPFNITSASVYTASSSWLHLLASWDTNFSASNKLAHLYVNGASDLGSATDGGANAFSVYYASGDFGVGASTVGGGLFDGCMAEVYFAINQYLDFSVQANREKFRSPAGKPVSLGADGSLPTGVAPTVFLNNAFGSFQTNKGTGGNFTVNGTLAAASTSPSD